ncbi:MAG: hypothetical protein COU63_00365 [Candidatus Pacebacteria bacterium CG10_big_fil_rev_8_21_14_0_10_36_11]|nr:hypothetical protein [Candidatus Pacearchaeota archaeon]OIP74209.1 MAG: hypothetical protein AUK08_03115 [Candidatus Pacebacteria bacterium CG2_30_36_39]PIR65112.1 MAG: hypothetical protein COU63_00365 [Candidatus Pacebacteria bacterium CG10_big_fil_rev_8_21_14_0_10_36_11]PJC42667.1 MAG: hypothetical protein CO040_03255 [Candidatus Pacebacteria bacterium CG_4_9_14_0_2_um_filter_36_8]
MNSVPTINKNPQETPLQTIQTNNLPLQGNQIQTTNTIPTSPEPAPELNIIEKLETPLADRLITKYGHWVHKLVVWGLTFQGLQAIYKSGVFVLVEIPTQSLALKNGLIGQEDVNALTSRIIIMAFSALISMVFAVKLSGIKSEFAKRLNTVIGMIIFFTNSEIIQFLNSQNSSKILGDLLLRFLQPK